MLRRKLLFPGALLSPEPPPFMCRIIDQMRERRVPLTSANVAAALDTARHYVSSVDIEYALAGMGILPAEPCFFFKCLGACRRRMPRTCADLKVPQSAPHRDASNADPRIRRHPLGVRRRHTPK